jgi:hypothetical protein
VAVCGCTGLNIHAIVCSADMAGLQEQLEIKYEQLKRGVEEYRAQLPEGWVVPTFKLPSSISAEMSEDIARLSKSPAVAKLSTRSESVDMLDRYPPLFIVVGTSSCALPQRR